MEKTLCSREKIPFKLIYLRKIIFLHHKPLLFFKKIKFINYLFRTLINSKNMNLFFKGESNYIKIEIKDYYYNKFKYVLYLIKIVVIVSIILLYLLLSLFLNIKIF